MDNLWKIYHPDYTNHYDVWQKCRVVFEGGESFLNTYLKKYSSDESAADFRRRLEISPIPVHAKSAILDIRNAIFQRMVDVRRKGGTKTYMKATKGEDGGVDRCKNTMTSFIGKKVLPDLLSIGKVGVLVDRDPIDLIQHTGSNNPYFIPYAAEDIVSWQFNRNVLTALLLVTHEHTTNNFGLVDGVKDYLLLYTLEDDRVLVRKYDKNKKGEAVEIGSSELDLQRIPFVIFDIGSSLIEDVANHQIALLNMNSADVDYSIRSNYPFYTEQIDFQTIMAKHLASQQIAAGADVDQDLLDEAKKEAQNASKIKTGLAKGRAYLKGLERPGFIAPPTEPLVASMNKEDQLKQEIRQLINLSLSSLQDRMSTESRKFENRGLEAGLSYVALELERGERELAQIWALFESDSVDITISYPDNYSMMSDEERIIKAEKIIDTIPKIPSVTHQRIQVKEVIRLLNGTKVSYDELKKMFDEVDSATIIVVDPEILREDHEAGLVSDQTASEARGYPPGDALKASEDHAARLARIVMAQNSAKGEARTQETGDLNKLDKQAGQNATLSDNGAKKVRGDE